MDSIAQIINNILHPDWHGKPYLSPIPETQDVGGPLGPSHYEVQKNWLLEQEAKRAKELGYTDKMNLPPVGEGPENNPTPALQSFTPAIAPRPMPRAQKPTTAPTMPKSVLSAKATPTPTINTGDKFADFTTAKVPPQLHDLIYNSAAQAGVDPNVFASVLFSEHGFITDRNKTPSYDRQGNFLGYDRGVAQINSLYHPEVTDEQAFDPNFAIPWAANLLGRYIQQVKAQGGTLAQGIAAYNVGVGGAMTNGPGNLGPAGQYYLSKITAGLTPALKQKLGLI